MPLFTNSPTAPEGVDEGISFLSGRTAGALRVHRLRVGVYERVGAPEAHPVFALQEQRIKSRL